MSKATTHAENDVAHYERLYVRIEEDLIARTPDEDVVRFVREGWRQIAELGNYGLALAEAKEHGPLDYVRVNGIMKPRKRVRGVLCDAPSPKAITAWKNALPLTVHAQFHTLLRRRYASLCVMGRICFMVGRTLSEQRATAHQKREEAAQPSVEASATAQQSVQSPPKETGTESQEIHVLRATITSLHKRIEEINAKANGERLKASHRAKSQKLEYEKAKCALRPKVVALTKRVEELKKAQESLNADIWLALDKACPE